MSLFNRPQSGYRYSGSGYNKETGIYSKGTKAAFDFKGTIQPMTGKEVESLMGARETRGMVKIYTKTVLVVMEEGSEQAGDLVVFNGNVYEVVKDMTYSSGVISHQKYAAAYREKDS